MKIMKVSNQQIQADSHKAWNYIAYLDTMMKNESGTSDISMSKISCIKSIHTVRKIRKNLLRRGIIKRVEKNLPNNEKIYQIVDYEKADLLIEDYAGCLSYKQKWRAFDENAMYDVKTHGKEYVKIRHYYTKPNHILQNHYPIRLYRKKRICPECQGKLQKLPIADHELDRRCAKCKFTFRYSKKHIRAYEKSAYKPDIDNKVERSVRDITRDMTVLPNTLGMKVKVEDIPVFTRMFKNGKCAQVS